MLRFLLLTGSLLFLMAGCERAEMPKPPSSQPQQAANDALGVLQKLVNSGNFKAMGFDSENEVKQAQLGQPLAIFNIPLDQLKSYNLSKDASSLLIATSETVYPVTVNGQVKSSVTIVQKEQGYQPSSFGNAAVIRRLAGPQGENTTNEFIVRVPALSMYFLGKRVEEKLLFVPVIEDPRLKLRLGEPVPAETVLEQLVPIANAYNGLPM